MADLLKKRNEAYTNSSTKAGCKTTTPSKASSLSKESLPDVAALSLSESQSQPKVSHYIDPTPQFPPQLIYFIQDKLAEKAKSKGHVSPSTELSDSNLNADQDPQWQESYEKMKIKGVTKSFKAFQKAVERFPDQCIRYILDHKMPCLSIFKISFP
jgi:hypothetical protein